MSDNPVFASGTRSADSALATSKVLRNTYMMLALTMVVSATTAGLSMWMNLGFRCGHGDDDCSYRANLVCFYPKLQIAVLVYI